VHRILEPGASTPNAGLSPGSKRATIVPEYGWKLFDQGGGENGLLEFVAQNDSERA